MSYPVNEIGKRLKSSSKTTMFHRYYPMDGSNFPDIKTLPAGKPSPIINGYVPAGYYKVDGNESGDYYIYDTDDLKVVSANSDDESSFSSGFEWALSDLIFNGKKKQFQVQDNISDGFEEAINDIKKPVIALPKYLKYGIYGIIGLLIFKILNLFD